MSNTINFMIPKKIGTAFERSEKILDLVFSQNTKDEMNDVFAVFNSCGNNSGKIYLPLNVSLEHLVAAQHTLGFNVQAEVRQNKVVLHY